MDWRERIVSDPDIGEAIAAANRFAVLRRDRANLADRLTRFSDRVLIETLRGAPMSALRIGSPGIRTGYGLKRI